MGIYTPKVWELLQLKTGNSKRSNIISMQIDIEHDIVKPWADTTCFDKDTKRIFKCNMLKNLIWKVDY